MVLPWLAAGWLAGVAGALSISLEPWQWLVLAGIAGGLARAVRTDRTFSLLFTVAALVALGGLRAQTAILHNSTLGSSAGRGQIEVSGTVLTAPRIWGDGTAFDLHAEAGPVLGVVRVSGPAGLDLRRGDQITVLGRWRAPAGVERMRYAAAVEAAGVLRISAGSRLSPAALLADLRRHLVERLRLAMPADQATLISGVVLGADEEMSAETREAFRRTGTAHILAVSGFNVTLVAAAALSAFGRALGARRGAVAAGAAIAAYTLLAGAEAPVVRAAFMAGLGLAAARLGRSSDALASLGAAAIAMTLVNPAAIGDIGFQLSFVATLALILADAPLQRRIERWAGTRIADPTVRATTTAASEFLGLTLVAQIATLPISAYTFHSLPVTSLPANLLILPAQPALMATGALAAVAAAIDLTLGTAVGWLAWPFATYTLRVAAGFAALPGASLELAPFAWPLLVLGYAVPLAAAAVVRQTRSPASELLRGLAAPAGLTLMAGLTVLAWQASLDRPDGRLHVVVLPGGNILVESPHGRWIGIVPSASLWGLGRGLEAHVPPTHPHLDWLIVSPGPDETAPKLEELGRFTAHGLLVNEPHRARPAPGSAEPVLLHAGVALDLGSGARLEVLEAGGRGLLLQVRYRSATFWIAHPSRSDLLSRPGTPTVLVLSGEAAGRSLLSPVVPSRLTVVSALPGEADPVGRSASPEAAILTTSTRGWIRLSTDGAMLEVLSERRP